MRGAARALNRDRAHARWIAWHTAALTRVEKIPDLDTFVHHERIPERKSPEQLLAIARQWQAVINTQQGG